MQKSGAPTRKRKTKAPCPECFLHLNLCICKLIPQIETRTRLSLIIHSRELKRTTNTGRLAIKALTNSQMFVRGQKDHPLEGKTILDSDYQPLLFFPSHESKPLTKEFLKPFTKPIQLIVPDGNWRQASKVTTRYPEFENIPRVMITDINQATDHLRRENSLEGMSTLEAIAKAYHVLEGSNIFDKLQNIYKLKLERTLLARRGIVDFSSEKKD